jgi:hypothetical protein
MEDTRSDLVKDDAQGERALPDGALVGVGRRHQSPISKHWSVSEFTRTLPGVMSLRITRRLMQAIDRGRNADGHPKPHFEFKPKSLLKIVLEKSGTFSRIGTASRELHFQTKESTTEPFRVALRLTIFLSGAVPTAEMSIPKFGRFT